MGRKRMEYCECPDEAPHKERCDRRVARCESRARALLKAGHAGFVNANKPDAVTALTERVAALEALVAVLVDLVGGELANEVGAIGMDGVGTGLILPNADEIREEARRRESDADSE